MDDAARRIERMLAEAESRERRGVFVPPPAAAELWVVPPAGPLRKAGPRCTPRQAAVLRQYGFPCDVSKADASRIIADLFRQ